MQRQLWDLFIAFFRASNFSFGGGPAMLPLIRQEAVERYHWLTEEEYSDYVAISNSLPAPIGTKLAGMIGYQVCGWAGVIVATSAVFLPTTLIVVLLGSVIFTYADTAWLAGMLKGVRPVVVVLLAQTALSIGKKAIQGPSTWVLAITTFLILVFLPAIHPAFLVLGAMILGYMLYYKSFMP